MSFVVSPTIKQHRSIPIQAVVFRSNFLAGYEPSIDATVVALGSKVQTTSTIFILPGQQGITTVGDRLSRLEKHLIESSFKRGAWSRLLRSLIPRPGLEVQIPKFSHRSIINATTAFKHLGLKDLFNSSRANLRGLNGMAYKLHLSDILQINNFAICEDQTNGDHHYETYPSISRRTRRKENMFNERRVDIEEPNKPYQRSSNDFFHSKKNLSSGFNSESRQVHLHKALRLKFDRPFLFVVRHNPTGFILHMGRFNPKLLP